MKAVVDKEGCISCGLCVSTCPEVFSFDDRGRQLAQAAVETLQSQNSRGPQ